MPTPLPSESTEYTSVLSASMARSIQPTTHLKALRVAGSSSIGDGGGAEYLFDGSASDADNSGSILNPGLVTDNGRWRMKLDDGAVIPSVSGFITGTYSIGPFVGIVRVSGTFGQQVALTLPKACLANPSGFLTVASFAQLTASLTASAGENLLCASNRRAAQGVSGTILLKSDHVGSWIQVAHLTGSG